MNEPPAFSQARKRRSWRRWGVFILVCVGIAVLYLWLDVLHQRAQERYQDEVSSFRTLGSLAQQMIQDDAEGVSDDGGTPHITSFEALFRYVVKQHPEYGGVLDGPNPFPGLLTEPKYGHLTSSARGPDEVLFWSSTVHHKNVGNIQMRLTCGGQVMHLVK